MLTKDQIRTAQDRQRQWLPIPEWTPAGEQHDAQRHGVFIGTISARDKESFEREFVEGGKQNVRAKLAILAVQNEDGTRVFNNDDAAWLGDKAAGPLSQIFDVALKINKLSKEDHKELVETF